MKHTPTCWDCRNSLYNFKSLECKKGHSTPEKVTQCPNFIDSRKESIMTMPVANLRGAK